MKALKLLLCCLCWNTFVVITKAQTVDTSIYYQLIERNLDVANSLAQVVIKNKKGQVLAVSKSLAFEIGEGKEVQAQKTQTTLYLYQVNGQVDSIIHPKVDFKYIVKRRTLFLEIPLRGTHPNFYTNSLHKIEIRAQKIEWKMDQGKLYFDNNRAAICFTSIDHFDASLMEAYQSLGNTNPLVKMGLYVQKKRTLDAWFDLKEITLLFDKRLDNVVFMDSVEIEKAQRNPAFKIIQEKQDFELFRKGYPTIFKFAGVNVEAIKALINEAVIDEKITLPLYLKMVKDGFLAYNKKTKQVQLQPKLFHYVAAMNRRSDYDYDYLKFWSRPIRDSIDLRVCLNLATETLMVPNIKKIVLGSRQKVIARPSTSVHLLPNRHFKFNGELWVGNTYFKSSDCYFEYHTYRVVLSQINQLNLAIYKRARFKNEWSWNQTSISSERALDEKGKPTEEVEFIRSVIEGGKGYLSIDTVSNKSGKNKKKVEASYFINDLKSNVYYDKCKVDGKVVYPRNSFYYELFPFQLNTINELKIEQLNFKGKFYSDNIFLVFENCLNLQFPDLSLGFDTLIRKTDKAPIYLKENIEGKGTFYGQLKLSNAGLVGNGTLTYLGASLGCDVFKFLPEQLEAKQVDSFSLKASKQFPKVEAKHIKMLWKPYENQMYLSSLFAEGFPFHFYYKDQKYRLDGQLTLSPKGLFGRGTLDWQQASMVSNPQGDYELKTTIIRSASADVLLKIRGREQFGFEQQNVRLELDFEQKIAHFECQDTNSRAIFPYNAYQTTFNEFDWDWKNNLLFMKKRDHQKGIFSREKRSLEPFYFEASTGIYHLNTGILQLKNLAPVKIGNAFLYLKGSILEIGAAAYIEKLEGKLIIGDTLNPTYILDAVELVWNVATTSFVSRGTSFELKRSEALSELVKGKIEVLPTKEGLWVTYYWIFSNGDWSFFNYKKGVLRGVSNGESIDGILLESMEHFESFRARWL